MLVFCLKWNTKWVRKQKQNSNIYTVLNFHFIYLLIMSFSSCHPAPAPCLLSGYYLINWLHEIFWEFHVLHADCHSSGSTEKQQMMNPSLCRQVTSCPAQGLGPIPKIVPTPCPVHSPSVCTFWWRVCRLKPSRAEGEWSFKPSNSKSAWAYHRQRRKCKGRMEEETT